MSLGSRGLCWLRFTVSSLLLSLVTWSIVISTSVKYSSGRGTPKVSYFNPLATTDATRKKINNTTNSLGISFSSIIAFRLLPCPLSTVVSGNPISGIDVSNLSGLRMAAIALFSDQIWFHCQKNSRAIHFFCRFVSWRKKTFLGWEVGGWKGNAARLSNDAANQPSSPSSLVLPLDYPKKAIASSQIGTGDRTRVSSHEIDLQAFDRGILPSYPLPRL